MIKKIAKKILGKIGYSIQRTKKDEFIAQNLSEILGFNINSGKYTFLNDSLNFLQALKDQKAVYFFNNDILSIEIRQLHFQINNWEELFILNEIFSEGIYSVSLQENFALLDIGMNVGIASLYFAGQKNCEIIFAYEPFMRTIELAKINMRLNECSKKIQLHNFGLGYPQRTVSVPYSEESRGSAGILGQSDLSITEARKHLQDLHIKDVSEYFAKNLEEYAGTFVAKIDCEGAEYEIIERLDQTGLLTKINIYMIEWHVRGHEILQSIFMRNDYYVLSQPNDDNTGLIYAIKK